MTRHVFQNEPNGEHGLDSGESARPIRYLRSAGFAGAILLLGELTFLILAWPGLGWGVAQMVGLELVAGREAGIPVALQAGAPSWLVIQVSMIQDLAVAGIALPFIFKFLDASRERSTWIGRRVARVDDAARRHRTWAERWGPVGVFVFMLVPFLVNGPVVAGVLGRGVGIPARRLVAPILGATFLSIVAWTIGYQLLFSLASSIDRRIPLAISLAIVAFVLGSFALGEARVRSSR